MKSILLTVILLITLNKAFSQCPQSGLKVIGANCIPPKDLSIVSVSCSSLNIKWTGNNDQAFILNAAYANGKDSVIEIETVKVSANNDGICVAAVPVKEGMNVKWNVQAICSKDSVDLYSTKVNGPDSYIPSCSMQTINTNSNNVHVYPNPASSYLIVAFSETIAGNIEFEIFDINGKKVYDKSGDETTKINNEYRLDLPNLSSGTYLIQIRHNGKSDQAKFELISK